MFPKFLSKLKRRRAVIFIILSLAWFPGLFVLLSVVNYDFNGRRTDTQPATGVSDLSGSSELTTVRLVLHRMSLEENTIESSLIIITAGSGLSKEIRDGKTTIRAV